MGEKKKNLSAFKKKTPNSGSLRKKLHRTDFSMVLILPSLSVLSEPDHLKNIHQVPRYVFMLWYTHVIAITMTMIFQQAIQKFVKIMMCIVLRKLLGL